MQRDNEGAATNWLGHFCTHSFYEHLQSNSVAQGADPPPHSLSPDRIGFQGGDIKTVSTPM